MGSSRFRHTRSWRSMGQGLRFRRKRRYHFGWWRLSTSGFCRRLDFGALRHIYIQSVLFLNKLGSLNRVVVIPCFLLLSGLASTIFSRSTSLHPTASFKRSTSARTLICSGQYVHIPLVADILSSLNLLCDRFGVAVLQHSEFSLL